MKFLVILAIAVFAASCDAKVVRQKPTKQQVDMVKDAFWDWVAKATTTADASLKQIRESQMGQDMNNLIAQSADAVNKLSVALRTQVAPQTIDFMTRFTQEAEQLKIRLEKDLTAVSTNMQPYAEELLAGLKRQVEDLKREATPYAQSMDATALKTLLQKKGQELRGQMEKKVTELQAQMVPLTNDMRDRVEQSLDDFQRSVVPLTQEIQKNLAPLGDELKAKLDAESQNLKRQLDGLWASFAKMAQ